jgi:hypothetical protein
VTEDHREVSPVSRGVMSPGGSTPIRPITGRRWLAPCSSTRRPVGSPCGWLSLAGGRRAYHVPPMYRGWGRSQLSADGTTSAPGELGPPGPDHAPFGPSLSAPLACSWVTTFNTASRVLTLPPDPGARPPWCWQSQRRLALRLPSVAEEATLSGGLVRPIAGDARPVGYCWQNSRCRRSVLRLQHSYIGDFVSHPNHPGGRACGR